MDSEHFIQTRWSLLSRLKDWRDDGSWQLFFETYWQLIYKTSVKAGLTDREAQDAVQETLLSVAKGIAEFKRAPAHGPFKGWLLHTTRWKIVYQFRKRSAMPGRGAAHTDSAGASGMDRSPAGSLDFEAVWDEEWQVALLSAALEKVKQKVSPQQVQIFDLCVVRGVPVKEVAASLQLNAWKVYLAQRRVKRLLKQETERLELSGF